MSFETVTVTGKELQEVIDGADTPVDAVRQLNALPYPPQRWSKVTGQKGRTKCGREVWHAVYAKLRYTFTKKRKKKDLRKNPIRAAWLWQRHGWQIDGSLGDWEVVPGELVYKD